MATPWSLSEGGCTVTFSNPAASATSSASAYVRAVLEMLGSREPLEVLGELPDWLTMRLRGVSEAVLHRAEAPGKWSVIEVIQHLADSDLWLLSEPGWY